MLLRDGKLPHHRLRRGGRLTRPHGEYGREVTADSLKSTRKLYDAKFIREIRGSVFRLAERVDPNSDIVVSGIDNVPNNLPENEKVVVGLSVTPMSVGAPLSAEDVIQDAVLDDLHLPDEFIVRHYLNRFVRSFPNSMPVFKYIRFLKASEIGKDVAALAENVASLDSFRTATIRKHFGKQRARFGGDLSIGGITRRFPDKSPFHLVPYLEEREIDVEELEKMLKEALTATEEKSEERMTLLKDTDYRKCVRIYDFLRYKKQEAPDLHQ